MKKIIFSDCDSSDSDSSQSDSPKSLDQQPSRPAYRYALLVEYDGSDFVGWQRQENGISIQGSLESAVYRLCGYNTVIVGAGRTDAGVHARGQVVHLELNSEWSEFRLQEALNFHLKPLPIAILKAVRVNAEFHARFSAINRHYCYRIIVRRAPLVMGRTTAWWLRQRLNTEAMAEAARYLVGSHDFTSFRASQCQAKSPIKTLSHLSVQAFSNSFVTPLGNAAHLSHTAPMEEVQMIEIRASAPSFLHHQVRNIVGTLVQIGMERWQPTIIPTILAAKNRATAGETAPPQGLVLEAVDYGTQLF